MTLAKRTVHFGGFTLVEIAVVLTVAAIMMGLVLKQLGLFDTAKTADTIKLIQDIGAATQQFKQRYGYLPGDLPSALNNFASLTAACNMTFATQPNIGNGAIDTNQEALCAIEELFRADLIRVNVDPVANTWRIGAKYDCRQAICVQLLGITYARSMSASYPVMPSSIRNVIALYNLPCKAAMEIESKYDDNNLATGNYRASVPSCRDSANDPVPQNDPVPIFVAPLV
jgi:type II secretory pathway pseudopilin PulG